MARPRIATDKPKTEAQRSGNRSLTLQSRLFVFLLFFLLSVMLGILFILFATGVFSAGESETLSWLENELGHAAQGVEAQFGALGREGARLSEQLSKRIEQHLESLDIAADELRDHPELLGELLETLFEPLQSALEKSGSSGAFVMLDATINPELEGAELSRAGLYMECLEPNITDFTSIRLLRGPAWIAIEHHMVVSLQWRQETLLAQDDIFWEVIFNAKEHNLPLSRLSRWKPRTTLLQDYRSIIPLYVPLVASDGTVLGACGFDVSSRLFKMSHTPDNSVYTHVFTMLAPVRDGVPDASGAVFAGNDSALESLLSGPLEPLSETRCGSARGVVYFGPRQRLSLYPRDSVYAAEQWEIAVLLPEEDLSAFVSARNGQMMLLIALLLMISVFVAAQLSRRYLKPIHHALQAIRQRGAASTAKTHIPEIDDLLEYLAGQDTIGERGDAKGDAPQTSFRLYDEFVNNIESLSPAERAVFNLYLEEYTAREIAEILCLSINTIKTHNRRIYTKLNVTSRNELLVYVNMMKEKGAQDER